MLSLKEAQELHELIGGALEEVENGHTAIIAELERARELAAVIVSDAEHSTTLTEPEKELLTQMISDYFDGLDNSEVEYEQPDLYKDLTDRCDDIERKLGLK